MKRLNVVGILAILPAVLVLVLLSDTAISSADTNAGADEITTGQAATSNSSADATITITMHTGNE